MKEKGLLEDRDCDLHDASDDEGVMPSSIPDFNHAGNDELDGRDCWLKYIIFDILYVAGPDFEKVMKCLQPFYSGSYYPDVKGSIIDLDLYQRRTILHKIIAPQTNQVEIVDSLVIRPDGTSMSADEYFGDNFIDDAYKPAMIDSIGCALDEIASDASERDKRRRNDRTDQSIEQSRAFAVDRFYTDIVEQKGREGLIFKDLSAPYILGSRGRSVAYWTKLKPDYEHMGAADLDLLVIGGFFATGNSRGGLLSQFLLACVDEQSTDGCTSFCSVCKINGGGK